MASTQKRSIWWHPEYPTPDGRRYCEANRSEAARLILEAKSENRLETLIDIHGRKHYRLLSVDRFWYAGHFIVSK